MGTEFLSALFSASSATPIGSTAESTAGSSAGPATGDLSKRRIGLVKAAFDVIAELGFEGLRTRAVAERAGVNVATLHYYFPTKQVLVEGVAQFLSAHFALLHGAPPTPTGYPALDRLRQEFADGRYYLEHEPGMVMVMQEFTSRGRRDAEVQKTVNLMYSFWRRGLEEMVAKGLADGTFRPELELTDTVDMLTATLTGWNTGGMAGQSSLNSLQRSVERWLLTDEVWKKTREAQPADLPATSAPGPEGEHL